MKIKEKLWLWGHGREIENKAGQTTSTMGRPGIGRLTTAEAAAYLGIPNACRVMLETVEEPPFDVQAQECAGMERVLWSALGCGRIHARDDSGEVIRLAREHANITGAVLDDFFPAANPIKAQEYPPSALREMRQRLCRETGRPMELWIVVYSRDLSYPGLESYLAECDVVSLWVWNPKDLPHVEEYYDQLRTIVGPDKPIVTGCYMWNFPDRCPMDEQVMAAQLETFTRWLREGKTDGIIFCHNYVVDLGLDAVESVRRWIAEHGNEELA